MKKTNRTFKDECGNEESIWFFIEKKDGKKFLQWAKSLGCRWMNGEEIKPRNGTSFFTISMHKDGTIANVPFFCYNVTKYKHIKRVNFNDIKKKSLHR